MSRKNKSANKNTVDMIVLSVKLIRQIYIWLDVPLHSEKARARNRIVAILKSFYEESEETRMKIVEKFARKEADGTLKILTDVVTGSTSYDIADRKRFDEAWIKAQAVQYTFDILPSNRDHWRVVRGIFENTKIEMDIDMTDTWEEIITALEQI